MRASKIPPFLSNDFCYIWRININPNTGYGQIWFEGKLQLIHRVAFKLAYPDIDISDKNICHKCDERACFNSAHLFAGSQSENMIDCINKGRHPLANKQFCDRGHEFNSENTLYRKDNRTRRICRACRDIRNKARYK